MRATLSSSLLHYCAFLSLCGANTRDIPAFYPKVADHLANTNNPYQLTLRLASEGSTNTMASPSSLFSLEDQFTFYASCGFELIPCRHGTSDHTYILLFHGTNEKEGSLTSPRTSSATSVFLFTEDNKANEHRFVCK